ncbi:MAG: YdbL family protein [Pseudomonadota bacterium]
MRKLSIALAAIVSVGLLAQAAHALPRIVEDAKSECIVGEQNDGYLGFVDGADGSAELRREVRAINQQRKQAYARIAENRGVSIADAAVVAAQELINKSGAGECVQDADGDWVEL